MKRTAGELGLESSSAKKTSSDADFGLFNPKYLSEETIQQLRSIYQSAEPFQYLQITDFINDQDYIKELEQDVAQREYLLKRNDLYEFYQTEDLNNYTDSEPLNKFKRFLTNERFREWLTKVTDIEGLHGHIDMFAAIYTDCSYLQCHDDKLEGRRIAYIYYLVSEEWPESHGGQLSLFGTREDGNPNSVPAVSIVPKRNSLMIFTVSRKSYHRVEQLLSTEGRLSIGGWFHGPPSYYDDVPFSSNIVCSPIVY